MNQFRRRLFPLCAFLSRIFRRVFRGVLKGSQISQISQILKQSQNGMNLFVTVYRVAVI